MGKVYDTLYDLRTVVSETNDVAPTLAAFLDRVPVRQRAGG